MKIRSVSTPVLDNGTQRMSRFLALDGLRGIAALVVVICHGLLVTPALSAAYGIGSAQLSGAQWLMTYSPLHIFWAGTEAVYLFFVLSGFVLALSMSSQRKPSWKGYYARRLIRLYLPVWAGVAFAVLTFAVIEHQYDPDFSGWLNVHVSPISIGKVSRDLGLIVRPGVFATQLWSLKWEVVFSLLLPVFLGVNATFLRNAWETKIAALVVVIAVGHVSHSFALFYLPMFGIGVVMASVRLSLAEIALRLRRTQWALLALAATVMVTAKWSLFNIEVLRASSGWPFDIVSVLGAAVLVFVFAYHPTAIRLGSSPPIRWLGKRSFSLYLVHEPIIATVAFAFHLDNGWIALAMALPVSVAASAVFLAMFEAPSHRLANHVGRLIDARGNRTPARG